MIGFLLDVALEYIDNQGSDDAFQDYLNERSAEFGDAYDYREPEPDPDTLPGGKNYSGSEVL